MPIRVETGYLLFNTVNGSLLEFSKPCWNSLQALLSEGYLTHEKTIDVAMLSKLRFLIKDIEAEYSLFRIKLNKERFDPRQVTIVIIPTLECNYNCDYCYRGGGKSIRMSSKVVCKIKEYISKVYSNINSLSVIWHGGEPLLAWDIIVDISEFIKRWSKQNGINYSSRLLTNGTLLTDDKIQEFENLNIRNVQISFDGPKKYYNKKHSNQNKKKLFELVISNIFNILHISPKTLISLKLDVYRKNSTMILEYLLDVDDLQKYKNVRLNFGHVSDYSCECNLGISEFLSGTEYAEWYWNLVPELRKRGWETPPSLPMMDNTICEADHYYSICVGPKGNICRCDAEVMHDEAMTGCVLEPTVDCMSDKYSEILGNYFDYYPINDVFCQGCNIMPLCGGGCPYLRYNKKITKTFCKGVRRFVELQTIDYWKSTHERD